MKREIAIFDIESYPNYFRIGWLTNFSKEEEQYRVINEHNIHSFIKYISDERDNFVYVGVNNFKYDSVILDFLIENQHLPYENICKIAHEITCELIEKGTWHEKVRSEYGIPHTLWHFDMLEYSGKGLKEMQVLHQWKKLEMLPIAPGTTLTQEEIKITDDYLVNDVYSTAFCFYDELGDYQGSNLLTKFDGRFALIETFNFNQKTSKSSEATLAVLAVSNDKDITKVGRYTYKQPTFNFNFKTDEMKMVYNSILNFHPNLKEESRDKFKFSFDFHGLPIEVKEGGLHASYNSMVFHDLLDFDEDSYYPNMIVKYGYYPENFDVEKYASMIKERITLKKSDNPLDQIKAKAYKIVLNSVYGKFKGLGSKVFAPHQLLNICFTGQLILLWLIETLYLEGIETVYANTDGITVKNTKEERTMEIFKEFNEYIDFTYETAKYNKSFFKDVNNYIIETASGKLKTKGEYLLSAGKQSYTYHRVVYKAIENLLIHNIPLEDTIYSCKDVHDFMMYKKYNKQYTALVIDRYAYLHDDYVIKTIHNVDKVIRWVACNNKNTLLVAKNNNAKGDRKHEVVKDSHNMVYLYEIDNVDVSSLDINYNFYITKAKDKLFELANIYDRNQKLTDFIEGL
jgi:DNA polymerase elongation subunit (family B)